MFRFDPDKLIKANYLGKGKFATVYPYDDEEKGKWVVKQVKTDKFLQASHHIQEIVLGFSCDHPNILGVKGFHIDFKEKEEKKVISEDEGKEKSQRKYKWIINMKIPRMKETLGDRYKSLNRAKRKFPQQELLYYFYNIVCGLEYLHDIKKIAHRDIKADNILLAKDQVKISAIRIAKFVGNEPMNLAPELLGNSKLKNKELYKADIWSLGVLLANLCLMHMKFEQGDPEKSRINALESLKKEFSPVMIDLIINMLNHEPDSRKPAKEIKRILEENFPSSELIEKPSNSQSIQNILSKKQSISGMDLTSNSLNISGMSTAPASAQEIIQIGFLSKKESLKKENDDLPLLEKATKSTDLKKEKELASIPEKQTKFRSLSFDDDDDDWVTTKPGEKSEQKPSIDKGQEKTEAVKGDIENKSGLIDPKGSEEKNQTKPSIDKEQEKIQTGESQGQAIGQNNKDWKIISEYGLNALTPGEANKDEKKARELNEEEEEELLWDVEPDVKKEKPTENENKTTGVQHPKNEEEKNASEIKAVLSEEKSKQGSANSQNVKSRPLDDIDDELFDSKDENKVAQAGQEELKSSNKLGKVEEPQILESTEELCKRMGEAANNLSQKWKQYFTIFSRENFPGLAIQSQKPDVINDQTVCDLLDDVKKEISEKNLQRAHGVTIALRYCKKLTRVATSKIVDTINETFKNLLYLELDFWAWNIKSMNEIMTELASKITAYHSSTLEQLGLFFAECLHVTDEGIKGLAQKVPQGLKKLKKLKLNFNRCTKITNNGITELAKSIAILNSITEIDLMFFNCVNVNDQSLHVLGKEFADHLKDIKMLNLVFSGCVDITGEGLFQFIQDIKVLKTLETFDLSLYQVEIEENIVSEIKNTLQHVNVVYLKLN